MTTSPTPSHDLGRHYVAAPDLELSVPARPENVSVIRHAVQGLIDRAGIAPEKSADVILAVGEACANAVMHAYEGQAVGMLGVRASLGRQLEVAVFDQGHGMAPRTDSPGLGLGLPLMATLASALELRPCPGGGTEVWMSFDVGEPHERADRHRFRRAH